MTSEPPALKRRHIAAVTVGNALEFYDFLVYSFFSIQIGHAFFPSENAYANLMLSLATFGAGFLTRPIGALVIGLYADRVGRRAAMMLSYIMVGCSIVAMALIPSYATIGIAAPILAVIARMVQGFSLGGEVGSSTAFLAEAASPARRGVIVSLQGVSQRIALIAGGSVGVALTALMAPDALDAYGWRIAFIVGVITVPFGLWLRANLPETLHGPDVVTARQTTAPSRLREARAHWRVMACGIVVVAAATIGSYTFNYIVTYAQATLHLSQRAGFIATTSGNVLGALTILLGAWLSDRWGRRGINVWGNFLFLLSIYPLFAWIVAARTEFALIAGTTLLTGLGVFVQGSFFAALAESLPKSIRGAGFGAVYSISIALFGGTTQFVETWLIHQIGPMAPAYYLIGATVFGQVALMLMRESAPVKLARA